MIRLIRFPLMVSCVVTLFMHFGCTTMAPSSDSSSRGGTGSEVVGVVEYPDDTAAAKRDCGQSALFGRPLVAGTVFINPRMFLSDMNGGGERSDTVTDNNGVFRITRVVPGEHLIYIRDNEGNAVGHIVTVPEKPSVINIGTLYARKTSGVAIKYAGTVPGDVKFYVDVRGTGLQLSCNSRNLQVTLDRIPTGVDLSHIITIRMVRPLKKGYDCDPVLLVPGVVSVLGSILD